MVKRGEINDYKVKEKKGKITINKIKKKVDKIYCAFCHKLIKNPFPRQKTCGGKCSKEYNKNQVIKYRKKVKLSKEKYGISYWKLSHKGKEVIDVLLKEGKHGKK